MYVAGQAGESHGTAFNCQFHVMDVESINWHISGVLREHTLEVVRHGSVSSRLHPLVLPTCMGCTLPLWVYFKGIIPVVWRAAANRLLYCKAPHTTVSERAMGNRSRNLIRWLCCKRQSRVEATCCSCFNILAFVFPGQKKKK